MAEHTLHKRLLHFVNTVIQSVDIRFYHDIYTASKKGALKDIATIDDFKQLPSVSAMTFAGVNFDTRNYQKKKRQFTKIIHHDTCSFLWSRTLDDIKEEYFGEIGNRPLVFFGNTYEDIEKCLWVFSKDKLPLIHSQNLDVTTSSARAYGIDSIISDTPSLKSFTECWRKQNALDTITHISIVDTHFDTQYVERMYPHAVRTYIYAQTETGTIAVRPHESRHFSVYPGVILEKDSENLYLVTKMVDFPTPLIRYSLGGKGTIQCSETDDFIKSFSI